ncbi:hypothetical protein TNIN_483681 [Trichonephila inaurata madagascariensis]|uniref:Uncharacterized protein n=1 Tax=Trichonephila inaurata madagascariensis TaxID=2747483 RepID=A0A8X6IKM0_9ARAC|nr:hypothetical protein TNIN_22221 [Trichonephila inaurata madagascariensis]GFY41250.1 hypothetical protein TNIN_483681 [Trichonephila inaurata madagascariensis]
MLHTWMETDSSDKGRCRELFVRFISGDTSLDDKLGRGQPSKFRRLGTFGSRRRGRKLENSKTSIWTFQPKFFVPKSFKSYGNWLNGSPTRSTARITPNVSRFASTKRVESVSEESCHWGQIIASVLNPQKKDSLRFASRNNEGRAL